MVSGLTAIVAVIFFIAGVFSAPLINPPPSPKPVMNITFAVNGVFDGEHVPFFVALDKGYYAQNGLNVKIVRGFKGADMSSALRQERFQ